MAAKSDFLTGVKQNKPRAVVGGTGERHPGSLWWDAETVLVTQQVGPGRRESRAKLVVPLSHGRLAFRLSSYSAQAARLRRDRRVIVQAGDRWGRPALGSREHQATVKLFDRGEAFELVAEAMAAKYGPRLLWSKWAHRWSLGTAPYADLAAVVTVHENTGTLALP
ncbi:hypothetical protein [Nocardia takedensis]|uniref:hypothetical protein n=1 Tax=Nocardia takedensis TaxID=259390 RepID=UPI0012F6B1BF|nr:hypothetical protein [Nocardia takedensis]